MQSLSKTKPCRIVVLGTGGTIAGTAASATDRVGYTAGQLGIESLLRALPALEGVVLETEQVAQLDSKDMDFPTWRLLAERCAAHLARGDVDAVAVTHGTDTLEETAYFLQRVLAPTKPVVLTAAMRPSTSVSADGPQNLLDAFVVAATPGACGVVVVLAETVHSGLDLRKTHTRRLEAFGDGDAGPVGVIEGGRMRRFRDWPRGTAFGVERLPSGDGPRIEIVTSHAGAGGALVDAIVGQGVDGIVAAGTGNGTLHHALEAALRRARDAGVRVWRSSRIGEGAVIGTGEADALPHGGPLTAVQTRIELLLQTLGERSSEAPARPAPRDGPPVSTGNP